MYYARNVSSVGRVGSNVEGSATVLKEGSWKRESCDTLRIRSQVSSTDEDSGETMRDMKEKEKSIKN